jgi:hypothetical protein
MKQKILWHRLTSEEALKEANSSSNGITLKEAAARLERDGPNR